MHKKDSSWRQLLPVEQSYSFRSSSHSPHLLRLHAPTERMYHINNTGSYESIPLNIHRSRGQKNCSNNPIWSVWVPADDFRSVQPKSSSGLWTQFSRTWITYFATLTTYCIYSIYIVIQHLKIQTEVVLHIWSKMLLLISFFSLIFFFF